MKQQRKSLWDRYKTYDPDETGYGGSASWKQAFHERFMGNGFTFFHLEPKEVTIKSNGILPLGKCKNMMQLKKSFRMLMLKYHPDRAGDTPENTMRCQTLIAQYERLKNKYL